MLDLPASKFRLDGLPKLVRLTPAPADVRVADRIGSAAIEAEFVSDRGVQAHWRAELRDGSSYIRQTLELSSSEKNVPLYGVELTDVRIPAAKTIGSVPGCPVAGSGMFFGVEKPGAQNSLDDTGARIGLACKLELSPAQNYSFGAVTGVVPEGQLRRAFLFYIERERARLSMRLHLLGEPALFQKGDETVQPAERRYRAGCLREFDFGFSKKWRHNWVHRSVPF